MLVGADKHDCSDRIGEYTAVHRVTVYCADLENLGLQQYLDVVEPNGTVYTSLLLSDFARGVYLVFDVKGY